MGKECFGSNDIYATYLIILRAFIIMFSYCDMIEEQKKFEPTAL